MYGMMKTQMFGVEVEMTGLTRAAVADIIADFFGTSASEPSYDCYHTRKIYDHKSRVWKVMRDGSIIAEVNDGSEEYTMTLDKYKVEIVTPPLKYEDIEILQEIIRKIRAAGGKVNSSCGIHVHVDGANHTMESLRRLVNLFVGRQDLIYEALNIGERENRWCQKMNPELLKEMKKQKVNSYDRFEKIWYSNKNEGGEGEVEYAWVDHSHYNRTRYHGINLHAFFTKGTVEFRLFNSTLHAGRIKSYIQFCLACSAWSIEADDNMSFRNTKEYTAEQKVKIMAGFISRRLGLQGAEFKTARYFLLWHLKKNAGMDVRAAA